MNVGRARIVAGCAIALGLGPGACATNDALPEDQAKAAVKSNIAVQLANLERAAEALQAAAPDPDADGWSDTADPDAVEAMRAHWKEARLAYELIEGPIVVFFPNFDVTVDSRYDGFIASSPDGDLFDGTGVIGFHGIERILWADSVPPAVVAFESKLPGYQPAAFPMNDTQAGEFKQGLAARLVSDTTAMNLSFQPRTLDTATAFRGTIDSIQEQIDKVTRVAQGDDESRYSQRTLADMRANLEGGRMTYATFRNWLRVRPNGVALDTAITAGFARVQALYDDNATDTLPPVPSGFDPTAPTPAQLATPYGKIFAGLSVESNPDLTDSLVGQMNAAADALRIPRLPK
jgi:iron uptake system component EfeO